MAWLETAGFKEYDVLYATTAPDARRWLDRTSRQDIVLSAGDLLFGPIREAVADRAPDAYREMTRIVRAELGGDVGLWGGLALALMELDA